MQTYSQATISAIAAFLILTIVCASMPARADDLIEKEGVAVGVTAGNLIIIPAKAVSVSMGMLFGALSFVLTGGNAELTQQIWRDTTQPPYIVTPELARKAIGQRPELNRQNANDSAAMQQKKAVKDEPPVTQ